MGIVLSGAAQQKPFMSPEELVEKLLNKGVTFNYDYTQARAIEYLKKNNNYYKLSSYRKNFTKGDDGKYIDLDFSCLVDLGIIDMLFRYQVMRMALDIEHFFAKENIIISEEFGSQKPAEKNYSNFMERYPDTERFIYVGDNTEKDFIAPNKLGWLTVGLLDKGGNIHKQRTDLPIDFLPKVWIKELREISSLIFPEADTKVL